MKRDYNNLAHKFNTKLKIHEAFKDLITVHVYFYLYLYQSKVIYHLNYYSDWQKQHPN